MAMDKEINEMLEEVQELINKTRELEVNLMVLLDSDFPQDLDRDFADMVMHLKKYKTTLKDKQETVFDWVDYSEGSE